MSSLQKFSAADLQGQIEQKLVAAIDQKIFPGAQFALAIKGHKLAINVGQQTYDERSPAVTDSTIYDTASLTKACVGLMVHNLIYQEKFDLTTPLGDFFRAGECSEALRNKPVLHPLSHRMVFHLPDNFSSTRGQETVEAILHAPFETGFRYGNFCPVIIGKIVEEVSGKMVSQALRDLTGGRPRSAEMFWYHEIGEGDKGRVAPTDLKSTSVLPHDGLTRQIGESDPVTTCGVAGLFANAKFVSWLLGVILHGGEDRNAETRLFHSNIGLTLITNVVGDAPRILAPGEARMEETPLPPRFSAGMDLFDPSKFNPVHKRWIEATFGFGGYTGCGFLVCPSLMTSMALLSNAIHDGTRLGKKREPRVQQLRKEIWELVLHWHQCNPW